MEKGEERHTSAEFVDDETVASTDGVAVFNDEFENGGEEREDERKGRKTRPMLMRSLAIICIPYPETRPWRSTPRTAARTLHIRFAMFAIEKSERLT